MVGMLSYSVAYWGHPEDVIWIDLKLPNGTSRRLQGHDTYWIAGDSYGVANDDANMGTLYTGEQAAAFRFTPAGEVQLDDPTIPPGARIWRGITIPDDDARQIGLI